MTRATTFDAELDNSFGYYDIQIDSEGDIKTNDFFNTAILMNVYCDKRANESEMQDVTRRRGWIGNESTPGFEIGSKLWLFYQERLTATMLDQLSSQLSKDVQWFIDEGLLKSMEAEPVFNQFDVGVNIKFNRHQSETETRYFKLWDRTQ